MNSVLQPYLIDFKKVGKSSEGYISIAEFEKIIPFKPKRIFWTYYTPESVIRGRHAHYNTEQILVAVSGKITVKTEVFKETKSFVLDNPNVGLYIPPCAWHVMRYSHNSVQLAFASSEYDESDYIRDYNLYKKIYGTPPG